MKGAWDDLFTGTFSRRNFLERSSLGGLIVSVLGASDDAEAQQRKLTYPPEKEKEKEKAKERQSG